MFAAEETASGWTAAWYEAVAYGSGKAEAEVEADADALGTSTCPGVRSDPYVRVSLESAVTGSTDAEGSCAGTAPGTGAAALDRVEADGPAADDDDADDAA